MSFSAKRKLVQLLNILVVVGVVVCVFLLISLLATSARQDKTAARQSEITDGKIIASQNSIGKQLSCLGAFFNQTDRQNLAIKNLKTCEIVHTDTGKTEILSIIPSSTSSSPATPSANQKQTSNKSTSSNKQTTPSANNGANSAANSSGTLSQVQAGAEAKVTVPDLCLPITNVCVGQ